MHNRSILFLICCSLLFVLSCDEEKGPMEIAPEFGVEEFQAPTRLNLSNPRNYDVSFRVTHPEGVQAVTQVNLTIFSSDQSTVLLELPLFDTGENQYRDVVAGDGIFSNHFFSDSTLFPVGPVYLQAVAVDQSQQSKQSDFFSALAGPNAVPQLLAVDIPDTLFSGSPPVLFSATVQDSDNVEDITEVTLRLKRNNNEVFAAPLELLNRTAADTGVFGAFYDSTFAAERDSLYTVEIQAKDLGEDFSEVITQEIFLENQPPEIFNLSMDDSLQLPPSGEITPAIIMIQVNDSQGLTDIDSVYFNSILPNGNPATNNPFLMYDNGLPFNPGSAEEAGDAVANDGIFTLTIGLRAGTDTGVYTFSFFVRDKIGNLTVGPVDSLIVYQ